MKNRLAIFYAPIFDAIGLSAIRTMGIKGLNDVYELSTFYTEPPRLTVKVFPIGLESRICV